MHEVPGVAEVTATETGIRLLRAGHKVMDNCCLLGTFSVQKYEEVQGTDGSDDATAV